MPRADGLWHLGMILPNYGPALEAAALLAATEAAEGSGADSAWVTDHVMVADREAAIYTSVTEALVTMGFLLGRTARLRIGVSALIVPQREPVLTFKQVASLDYLSRGRLILAVAPGWLEPEFRRLSAPFAGRGQRLDMWLEFVRLAQDQMPGPIERAGSVPAASGWLAPAPARSGGIELWAAGSGRKATERAAQLGVWHPVALRAEQIAPLAQQLRARRPDAHVVPRLTVVFKDEPAQDGKDERGRYALAGPSSWVAEQLTAFRQAGCDGFLIALEVSRPGLDERIYRFGAEVLPRLTPTAVS